jgi:hypothetical protein
MTCRIPLYACWNRNQVTVERKWHEAKPISLSGKRSKQVTKAQPHVVRKSKRTSISEGRSYQETPPPSVEMPNHSNVEEEMHPAKEADLSRLESGLY